LLGNVLILGTARPLAVLHKFSPNDAVWRRSLRRSFSTHGKQQAHPTDMQAQLGHSNIRTTLNIYTQTLDAEVLHMANEVTNRLLQLGKESGAIQ
jgi:integrase